LVRPPERLAFYLSTKPIDVALYCDAIIALYPRKPGPVLENIITPGLEIQRSFASKLAVIRSLIGITVELKKSSHDAAQEVLQPLYGATCLRILSIYRVSGSCFMVLIVFR
jgi:hypothetical protein